MPNGLQTQLLIDLHAADHALSVCHKLLFAAHGPPVQLIIVAYRESRCSRPITAVVHLSNPTQAEEPFGNAHDPRHGPARDADHSKSLQKTFRIISTSRRHVAGQP